MKLFPYDSFTLQTRDSLPILLQRLATQIEPEKVVRWAFSRNHAPYEGTLSEAGFQIRRIIDYRNSFLPMIRGRFEPVPSGTIVRITLLLHPFVMAFLGFWYLVWYGFFLPIWLTGAMPVAFALQFLGLPIALLVAFWGAFWSEVHRSRRELAEMILGQADQPYRIDRFSEWIPKAVQWGIFSLGLTMALLQMTGTFRPSILPEEADVLAAASCAESPHHSPDCKFSLVRTLVGHPAASALAISADGKTLVSGGNDKAIKVWDVKTGQLQKTLQSDSGKITAVAIAPNGKTVVSGSADHMVRIWDLTTAHPAKMLSGHSQDVTLVSISPDGKTVISASYGAIKQWDLATGQLKATFPEVPRSETKIGPISLIDDHAGQFNPLDINPTSNTALISGLKLVDLATNQIKTVPTDQVSNFFVDYFLSAHRSPDGKLVALQYGNQFRKFETRLKVWDLTTGAVQAGGNITFSHGTFMDVPLALSRDRIFASVDGQLELWNLQTAKLEAVLDADWMSHLVVTPDGKLLAGLARDPDSDKVQIKIWQR